MALNTDYAIRTGAFEPEKGSSVSEDLDEMKKIALERYNMAKVSCIQSKNNFVFLFDKKNRVSRQCIQHPCSLSQA